MERILIEVFEKHAPETQKKVRGLHCPWRTPEIPKLIKARDYHLTKAKQCGNDNNWKLYREYRNKVYGGPSLSLNFLHDTLKSYCLKNVFSFSNNFIYFIYFFVLRLVSAKLKIFFYSLITIPVAHRCHFQTANEAIY